MEFLLYISIFVSGFIVALLIVRPGEQIVCPKKRRVQRASYKQPRTIEDALNFLFDHNCTLRMIDGAYSVWLDDVNGYNDDVYIAFTIENCNTLERFFSFYMVPVTEAIWKKLYDHEPTPATMPVGR